MSETRDIISIADIKAIRIKCLHGRAIGTPTRFYRGILQERCPECLTSRDSRLTADFTYVCEAIQAIQKMESEGTQGRTASPPSASKWFPRTRGDRPPP